MSYLRAALAAALLLMSSVGMAAAGEYGTREEAQALLERAVAMLKADEARALDLFTSGDGGFIDRDLYVFCGGSDGMMTAHPFLMGNNVKAFKDSSGKAAGEEMYAVAKESEFAEVSYKFNRPGEAQDIDKVSFVTKVGDQVCGVGYYK